MKFKKWPAWIIRAWRYEAGLVAGVFALCSLTLAFGMLAEEVLEGDTRRLDAAVLTFFRSSSDSALPAGPPWLIEMGRDITALGSFACLGVVFIASVGYLLLIRKRALAMLTAIAVLGGVALSTILKMVFDRPRPDLGGTVQVFTASFPSGHAMLSAVTFLTLGALLTRANNERRTKVYFMTVAVLVTLLVGVSRLYLGVHYPSDVLAGWVIGTAWAVFCWTGAYQLQRRGRLTSPAGERKD